ncbi:MAG: glutathione-regulated potassium-efflux system protein KefB [Gammaproteobacteria bacterium]|nr:glutathione-regulated potassium-efflux system protein KefB [Gammaproteobacteria bacterium]
MGFLQDAVLFMTAALIVVPLGKRLGLSPVLGYLGAGVLIGPWGTNLIGDAQGVLHFAEIGVVFLLFLIGLELQPRRLWVMRREVFGLGSAQVVLSTLVFLGAGILAGFNITESLFAGFALALSSTAFVLQLLGETRKLQSPHGRASFGVLLFQDAAVIPALAAISLFTVAADVPRPDLLRTGLVIVALAIAGFSLRPLLRYFARTGIDELFAAAGLMLVLGAALAMSWAGLSMGLGAFIAGMMVAESEYRHQIETDILPFKGLLLGLFFIAVGMSANLGVLTAEPLTVIAATLGLVATKALVLYPLLRIFRLNHAESVRGAVLLSQGGEFAFVLLTAGVSAALLPESTAEFIILVVTLSMVTTPLLSGLVERFLNDKPSEHRPYDSLQGHDRPVVIAGFGRIGQIVGRVLGMRHIPFMALDANPGHVDFLRQFGNEVYFGDATRLDSLRAAGLGTAKALVLTIEDIEASVKIAETVRKQWPDVMILARARNRHHEMFLREVGVHYVIRETLLSSLELSEVLLMHLGVNPATAREEITAFRLHDEEMLERQAAVVHDESAFRQTSMEAEAELRGLFTEDDLSSHKKD